MRRHVIIVDEDNTELEINFNCDEDPKSRHRLTFRLHPPSPELQNESSRDKNKNLDKSPEIHTLDSDDVVEFVIKVWKYKGYCIVQHGVKVFTVYSQSGDKCGEADTLKGACSIVEEYLDCDESKEKQKRRPRP